MSKKQKFQGVITMNAPFSIKADETFELVTVSRGSEAVFVDAVKDGKTYRLYPRPYLAAERELGTAELEDLFNRTVAAAARGDLTRVTKNPSGE